MVWPDTPFDDPRVSLVVAINPFDLVSGIVLRSKVYWPKSSAIGIPAAVTLAAAPLTAYGIDYCLSAEEAAFWRAWCVVLTCLLLAGGRHARCWFWFPVGSDFLTGWEICC